MQQRIEATITCVFLVIIAIMVDILLKLWGTREREREMEGLKKIGEEEMNRGEEHGS